jgi:hypothetical protein
MSDNEHPLGLILMRRLITVVQESGASQIEAVCALDAVKDLLPILPMSYSGERELGCGPAV